MTSPSMQEEGKFTVIPGHTAGKPGIQETLSLGRERWRREGDHRGDREGGTEVGRREE